MERAKRADPVIAVVMDHDGFHNLVAHAVTQVLDFMPRAAGLLHFCSLHMRDKPALLAAPGLLEAAMELTGFLHDLAFGPDQRTGHSASPRRHSRRRCVRGARR